MISPFSPKGLPRIERDQVGNGDEIVLLGAGEAKRRLYEVKLDPQYWYDKAIERHLVVTLEVFYAFFGWFRAFPADLRSARSQERLRSAGSHTPVHPRHGRLKEGLSEDLLGGASRQAAWNKRPLRGLLKAT